MIGRPENNDFRDELPDCRENKHSQLRFQGRAITQR